MQKILRKRVFRDLKENLFRYIALGSLIILSMYMVVSLIGAAETIISGGEKIAKKYNVEDGQFSVFVPLTDKQKNILTKKGVTLEEQFYLDYQLSDKSIVRAFKNRETINRIILENGNYPENDNEIILEKRYCAEHNISIGDTVTLGSDTFKVVGTGCVSDYNAPYKNISDSIVDSKQFGMAFLTENAYNTLKENNLSMKTEEYTYAYTLNDNITDSELKEELKKFKVDTSEISDSYFHEYWDETAGKKDDLVNGINDLLDGSNKLSDGLNKLSDYNKDLTGGAGEVFDSYLKQASDALSSYGLTTALTEENFENELDNLLNLNSANAILRMNLRSLKTQLSALKDYKNGINDYTDGVDEAADGAKELYDGIAELKGNTDSIIDELFDTDLANLTQFIPAKDNPRISAAENDQVVNKLSGLAAGVIIMILFTYVISVFVVHNIERESSIIGALYALGVNRHDLLLHYLTLPVIVTVISSIIGTLIGFSPIGIQNQMSDSYVYFSFPKVDIIYPPYLMIYALIMPAACAIIVNWLVIRKKLSKPVLSLIRNENKAGKISKTNLGNMNFINKFRIRQMIREIRTALTVIFGMFICLLILMLSFDCFVMCKNISRENKADTKYEYMYTYKYPEEEPPKGGIACFAKTLKKEKFGYNLDVTIIGTNNSNPYFDVSLSSGENTITLSSAAAQKFQLKAGDKVIMTDEETDRDYAFTVDGITQYSPGLYAFMDIDSMRDLFGESENYYNIVFSDKKLDIPSGRLYSYISKSEIEKSSNIFVNMMMPMVYMLSAVSIIIFCVVMYLMIKVMIDRSSFGISLIKIFGYRMSEIKQLYLTGNLYIIAIGALICIPLSKIVMDSVYPLLISNIGCSMNLHFPWYLYVAIYAGIIMLYLIISHFLVLRLKKITPAQVLKNRE